MKRKIKLQELNDIEERTYIMKIIEKLKYSSKVYTEEEITKMLNPYEQQYLHKLSDMPKINKPISIIELAEVLYKWGYIRVYNNLCYARKPYTYNYIIPILKNGRLVGYDEELVLTPKVEEKLQQYYDQ